MVMLLDLEMFDNSVKSYVVLSLFGTLQPCHLILNHLVMH
jgi:hypothetical protein